MNSGINERLESNSSDECDLSEPTVQQHRISSTRKALFGRLAGLTIGLVAASQAAGCQMRWDTIPCDGWINPDVLYRDSDSAIKAVEELDEEVIKHIDPRLLRDEGFVLELLKRTSAADVLKYCIYEIDILRRKPDFMLKAMDIDEKAFEYADDSLKSNRAWLLKAMDISIKTVAKDLSYNPKGVKDKEIVKRLLEHNIKWLKGFDGGSLVYSPVFNDHKFIREIIEMKPKYVIPILLSAGVNLVPNVEYIAKLVGNGDKRFYRSLSTELRLHPTILRAYYNDKISEDDAKALSRDLKDLNLTIATLRFDLEILQTLVDNRLHPEKGAKKPTATVTFPKADRNRNFEEDRVSELVKHGYQVMYYEAATEDEAYASLVDSTRHTPKKQTDLWILAGHGGKRNLRLGRGGGEKKFIDTKDFELRKYRKYLKPGAQIVLMSCSVGKGAGDSHNLANFIHRQFPETMLHAAAGGTSTPRLAFDPQTNLLKRVIYPKYKERVYHIYPESDKSELAEKTRKGGRKWLKDRWKDPQFVLEELKYGSISTNEIDESLLNNTQFVAKAAKTLNIKNASDFFDVFDPDDKSRNNPEFMLIAIQINAHAIHYTDESLRSNPDFLLKALKLITTSDPNVFYHEVRDPTYNSNAKIMLELIRIRPEDLRFANNSLFSNPDFVLGLMRLPASQMISHPFEVPQSKKLPGGGIRSFHVRNDGTMYVIDIPGYVERIIKTVQFNDPDFMLKVIKIDARHKRLIPKRLLNDPEFMKKVNQISPPSN